MSMGDVRQLKERLRELLREVDEVTEQIQRTEAGRKRGGARHAAPRPARTKRHLSLYTFGKSVIITPVAWVWAQMRDHTAQAVTWSAAGVVAGAGTLGVATPVHPEPVGPPTEPVVEVIDSKPAARPPGAAPSDPTPDPTPTPAPTVSVDATPTPTVTPTSSATPALELVEELGDEVLPPELPALPSPTPMVIVPPVEASDDGLFGRPTKSDPVG